MLYIPKTYQTHATKHIVNNPITATDGAGLLMQMGTGKTAATLTAVDQLLVFGDVEKPLIIGPKLVAEHTWTDEIEKWDHLKHLTVSKILGDEKQRLSALRRKADLYIINRDNVAWLVSHYGLAFPFDMIIIDELSSFKNPSSVRFKALKAIRPKIKRVVGLTGTPAPNGLQDLWSQVYLLDQGKRLGKSSSGFKTRYFRKENTHAMFSKYEVLKGSEEDGLSEDFYEKKIYNKVSDICISIQAKDWLELPERIDVLREVKLNSELMDKYLDFEKEQVMKLAELDEEISAPNAAALINKLLQFSNGAVYYGDSKEYYEVHNEKIFKLGEELEAANGNPLLIIYQFQSDVARIKKHLKEFKPKHIHDGNNMLKDWNAGKIPVLLGHAASMGHGLNMQAGGHLITHFGVGWALELYQQVVARLHRQGQGQSVINGHLLCPGTYDPIVYKRLTEKGARQQSLMDAVKALIQKHKN